jgi:hypothetical protein
MAHHYCQFASADYAATKESLGFPLNAGARECAESVRFCAWQRRRVMKRDRKGRLFLCFAFLTSVTWLGSWAVAEKQTVEAGKQVTVTTDSSGNVTVRHEAIVGIVESPDIDIVVKTPPPAPKEETPGIKPPADGKAIWVPGYWRWNSVKSDYEWIPGTYRMAVPEMTWHPGKWVNVGDGHVWQSGYWGPESVTETIVVKEAPPAPQEETKPPLPGPGYVWVPGYWSYENGKFVWQSGAWRNPVGDHMIWIEGKWLKTATGYRYIPGHWDFPPEKRVYATVITK